MNKVLRAALMLSVLLGLQGPLAQAAALEEMDFAAFNISVTPAPNAPDQVILEFDSKLLGFRARNRVELPAGYADSKKRWPVVYYLHGTRGVATDDIATQAPRAIQSSDVLAFGGPQKPGDDDNAPKFLRVILDDVATAEDWPGWCGHCWWVDGRKGIGVLAESYLYKELIPIVEHSLGARSDRSGRGVMGYSMGGFGALIQGYRHPDLFAFVGSLSPTLVWEGNNQAFNEAFWQAYLVDQGYPPPSESEILYRNIEPYTLATNAIGTGLDTIIALGDGCVISEHGLCEGEDPEWAETLYRNSSEAGSARLTELGLPHFIIKREGKHGDINPESYFGHMVPRMNDIFAAGLPDPHAFSYKSADPQFEVWGYSFAVERPNTEFLNVLAAQLDGRNFTLAGTGTVTVTTPASFRHGRVYTVQFAAPDGRIREELVRADEDGRIMLTVHLGEPRNYDERLALVNVGQFLFPHTRVNIKGH